MNPGRSWRDMLIAVARAAMAALLRVPTKRTSRNFRANSRGARAAQPPLHPLMPRLHSFRSFSLRTLLLLVTAAAVAAWLWSTADSRPEARVLAAFAAIVNDNPDAQIAYWRVDGELAVFAAGVRRISPRTARLVVRANMIRFISLSSRDADGLIRSVEDRSEACSNLRTGFERLEPGLTIRCFRRFDAKDIFSGRSTTWRPGADLLSAPLTKQMFPFVRLP